MTDDGVCLSSIAHPVPPLWKRVLFRIRLALFPLPRRSSMETCWIEIEDRTTR
jgi:hypothetical protein